MKKALLIILLGLPTIAFAHEGGLDHSHGIAQLVAGLLHVLTGWDHLAALFGLALLLSSHKWLAGFTLGMGLVAGMVLAPLGYGGWVEASILIGLVALVGLYMIRKRTQSFLLPVSLVTCLATGAIHGLAHGTTGHLAYSVGVVLASISLFTLTLVLKPWLAKRQSMVFSR